jgi:hypothetical protein
VIEGQLGLWNEGRRMRQQDAPSCVTEGVVMCRASRFGFEEAYRGRDLVTTNRLVGADIETSERIL